MRISFVGTHSTGKTSLLEKLKEAIGESVYFINEVAERVTGEGYLLGMQATEAAYARYISLQLAEERMAEHARHVISDRCVLDTFAYSNVNIEIGVSRLRPEFYEGIYNAFMLELHYFDQYVYFPVEFELMRYPVEPVDVDYRMRVDVAIRQLLEVYHPSYLRVSGTNEVRLKTVLGQLNCH